MCLKHLRENEKLESFERDERAQGVEMRGKGHLFIGKAHNGSLQIAN